MQRLFASRIVSACCVGMAIFITGCASIVHGTRQSIKATSTPPATVKLDGVIQGTAPMKLRLKRGTKLQELTFEKEGCQPNQVKVSRHFSAWYVGNIVFGGIIGIIVDAVDGAMWTLTPKSVDVVLQCPTATTAPAVMQEGAELVIPK